MKKRNATAVWNGSGKEGSGNLSTQSEAIKQVQYSYMSRFEEGVGTNPEELMAAAHAGCFSMKLAFVLGGAGFTPESIETKCEITLEPAQGITMSELSCKAKVPGIDAAQFEELAQKAKAECPVSKAYGAIQINLNASLA
jgi:osmotically inducible protein OsmC